MPRINAPTVEEHREAQRRALLEAAKEIVLSEGLDALRFGDLAERAGLARPSVYEYFRNKADLVRALLDDEFPRWHTAVSRSVVSADGARAAVEAFVRSQLELTAAGRHDFAFALMAASLDTQTREDLEERHLALLQEIAPALRELGVAPAGVALHLLSSVVAGSIQRLRSGGPTDETIETAVRFVRGGLEALREEGGSTGD